MQWYGDTLIFRCNGDGCAALYSGEVTPTEDNYVDDFYQRVRAQNLLHNHRENPRGEL